MQMIRGIFYIVITCIVFHTCWKAGRKIASDDFDGSCLRSNLYVAEQFNEYKSSCNKTYRTIDRKILCDNEGVSSYHLYRNILEGCVYGSCDTSIFQLAFPAIRHPGSPGKAEFYFTRASEWPADGPVSICKKVVLTRTGSKESTPCKCVAVTLVNEKATSPQLISHRIGQQAGLTNQYQGDFTRQINRPDENLLLKPFLRDLPSLINHLKSILGEPLRPDGSRRAAIVMVANEGVMDLLLNFLCSASASKIDMRNVIVFLGQEQYLPLMKSMGIQAMIHPSLGSMPAQAAKSYADGTFTRMMWLKVTSVYLTSAAGFDVLFQDVDLVWMRDPLPFLQSTKEDAVFMDDGARTPRFTPFYANTGFYFMRRNFRIQFLLEYILRGVSQISQTKSHQAPLNRYLQEAQALFNLQIKVLDNVMFPSGIMFHHNKTFMHLLSQQKVYPYVFHMCWTESRDDKVKYFKQIDMWFLPDDQPSCNDGRLMLNPEHSSKQSVSGLNGLIGFNRVGSSSHATKRLRAQNNGHRRLELSEEGEPADGSYNWNHSSSPLIKRCCKKLPHWEQRLD